MAQDYLIKQTNWLQRFSPAVVQFLAAVDVLQELCSEYSANAFGTGGANAIVDATAQGVLPATTALIVAEAVGTIDGANQVLNLVGQGTGGRGYLENMRP